MQRELWSLGLCLPLLACGSSPGWNGQPNGSDAGDGASKPIIDSGSSGSDASGDANANKGPTLEIVSGNGGTVPSGWPATDPLRVRARDGQGNVVAGAVVTFTVGAGQALHIQSFANDTATTDQDGIASVTYNAFPIQSFVGHESDTVTASWNSLSVDFDVIITQVPSGQYAAPPLVEVTTPDTSPELGTAKAGTTLAGGIKATAVFQQGPDYGLGVPGWGFRLTKSGDLLSTSEVACTGGTAIADGQGHMSCDVVVPSTPGDYYFSMLAGGAIRWDGHLKAVP